MRDETHGLIRDVTAVLRAPVRPREDFDARVMAQVLAMPRHRPRPAWRRLLEPRTVTIHPARWAAMAASIVAVVALDVALHARTPRPPAEPAMAANAAPTKQRPVQFVIVAPTAKKVAVVGDFNGWDPKHKGYRAHHQGGGVWSLTARVPVGHHRYAFLIDDSLWMADPAAPRAIDDDYGVPSSTIDVGDATP